MTDDRHGQGPGAGSSRSSGQAAGPIPSFDLYAVLGVRPDATHQEIREAVAGMDRRLQTATARQRGGATARQKRFNIARYWLLDPARRRAYDAELARRASAAGRVRGGRVRGGSATRGSGAGSWLSRPLVWVGAVVVVAAVAFLLLRPGSSGTGSAASGSPVVNPSGSAGGSAAAGGASGSAAAVPSPAPSTDRSACPSAQPAAAPAGQSELVTIETPKGTMEITVVNDLSPIAAGNFVALASCGYYDGVVFHRVVPNFVIQGGDPTGTGTGGPGYTIQDEPVTTTYSRATVAMARTADPNSVGSQFFIVLSDDAREALQSANTYQIVGSVTKGMEVADAIAAAADAENPTQPIPMTKVTAGPPAPYSPPPSSGSPSSTAPSTAPSAS
jgi:cyclophilin family peptidyl-prolyl cis-trans isomerase